MQSDKQAIDKLKSLNASINDKLAALDTAVDDAAEAQRAGRGAAQQVGTAARRTSMMCCCRRCEKAQTDITMASMTAGGDAQQSTMTLLRLVSTRRAGLAGVCRPRSASSIWPPACWNARAVAPGEPDVDCPQKGFQGDRGPRRREARHRRGAAADRRPAQGDRSLAGAGLRRRQHFRKPPQGARGRQAGQKLLGEARAITDGTRDRGCTPGQGHQRADPVRRPTRSDAAISFGTLVMLRLPQQASSARCLFVWLYIGRNLVARLVGLEERMTRLAGGDMTAEIRVRPGGDEIGRMAQRARRCSARASCRRTSSPPSRRGEQQAKQEHAGGDRRLTRELQRRRDAARWRRCRRRRRT